MNKSALLLIGVGMFSSAIQALADNMIRIKCDDDASGALVYVDKKEMGECPMDISLAAGVADLRVVKMMGEDQERVFEKKLRIVDGVVQRIEVVLSPPQITAEGSRKRNLAEYNALLQAAQGGQIAAMHRLADAYQEGRITKSDSVAAANWRAKADRATDAQNEAARKAEAQRQVVEAQRQVAEAQKQLSAAQSGDIDAMGKIAAFYQSGTGIAQSDSDAAKWRSQMAVATRERERRYAEEKRAKAEQERKQNTQQKIDSVRFFSGLREAADDLLFGNTKRKHDSFSGPTAFSILSPASFVTGLVAAPTQTTELTLLKSELALRPSTWGNPDSMIARASRRMDAPVEVALSNR